MIVYAGSVVGQFRRLTGSDSSFMIQYYCSPGGNKREAKKNFVQLFLFFIQAGTEIARTIVFLFYDSIILFYSSSLVVLFFLWK